MKTFLLAAALFGACMSPVLADSVRTHGQTKQVLVKPAAKQLTQEQLRRRKFEETYVNPYWDPCDYTTNWGPHACGGN